VKSLTNITGLFKVVFRALFYLLPISVALYWVMNGRPDWLFNMLNLMPQQLLPLSKLAITTKLLGFVVTLLPMVAGMLILHFLSTLFGMYQQKRIFELANAKCFRNIAIVTIGWQIIRPLYDVLISLVLTIPQGHTMIYVMFDVDAARNFLIGVVMYVVALVMLEGSKMREEQEFTV